MNHPILIGLNGDEEPLYDVRHIKRVTELNGERSLTFSVLNTEINEHAQKLLMAESKSIYDGVTYTIKRTKEKNLGKRSEVEVSLKHKMFTDLIDHFVYTEITGFKSLTVALTHILNGTGYTYSIIDSFATADVGEVFGNENALSLLQKILKLFGAEFNINGTHFTFKKEIGNKTDIQYRYKHNINGITKEFSTENLSTHIKGFGKDGLTTSYTSPNASLYPADTPDGLRHQQPVEDERYTTQAGLLERLKQDLNDQPELSIEVDFVDLRNAGYPYEIPNIGDEVFVIYEPMNLDVTARIIKIEEEIDAKSRIIKTSVTLSNFANNLDDMIADLGQTQKEINKRFTDDGKVKYDVLPDFVKMNTEILQNAQTEIEFTNNGLIGRSKIDPNDLTLFSSEGFGISTDGGQTFSEAITAKGFNLSVGAIGHLDANNITISGTLTGALLQTATSGKRVKIQIDDYAAYDGNTQKISMGFRQLSGGSFDAPRFAMGVKGMNTTSTGGDGSYFVATHYPAEDNPMNNNLSYIDLAYACVNSGAAIHEDRYSNIKMFDDGIIRIAPVKALEITSNYINNSYDPNGEKRLALFGTANSTYFNSHLQIGAIVNKTNPMGLVLADDRIEPYTRVRVQTDSEGGQYFRPANGSGDIQLGSPSFPWESVFAVNGAIQSSAIARKSDINLVQPYNANEENPIPNSITTEDVIDFIHNVKPYTYVYKKGESYTDDNGELQTRLVDRTVEDALQSKDLESIQLGILADENINYSMAHFILTGEGEDLGVKVMPVLTAAIITIQEQEKRIKALEQKSGG